LSAIVQPLPYSRYNYDDDYDDYDHYDDDNDVDDDDDDDLWRDAVDTRPQSEHERAWRSRSDAPSSHDEHSLTRPHEPTDELQRHRDARLRRDLHQSTFWKTKPGRVATAHDRLVNQRLRARVAQFHLQVNSDGDGAAVVLYVLNGEKYANFSEFYNVNDFFSFFGDNFYVLLVNCQPIMHAEILTIIFSFHCNCLQKQISLQNYF